MGRNFTVLLPCFYGTEKFPKVKGAVGPVPNAKFLPRDKQPSDFAGRYIPPYVKEFTFIFDEQIAERDRQSIYMYFDFWLVTEAAKVKLEYAEGDSFEFYPARTFESSGEITHNIYWIAKVVRTVDCVNASESFVEMPLHAPSESKKKMSFSEAAIELSLTTELVDQFANYGQSVYRTYPHATITEKLVLKEDQIPDTCSIFTPSNWPGHVICDENFYNQAISRDYGYSVWSINLPDLQKRYHKMVFAMR